MISIANLPVASQTAVGTLSSSKIAKRTAITSDFPSQANIASLAGREGQFWGPTDCCSTCACDPTEISPPIARQVQQYPCRTVFSVESQPIAATTPLVSVKMAYCNPKTGLGGGDRRKNLPLKPIALLGTSHEIVSPLAL